MQVPLPGERSTHPRYAAASSDVDYPHRCFQLGGSFGWHMSVVCLSPPTTSDRPAGTSYLAFGVADGSVGLLKLQEKLYSPNNPEFSFTPDYQVDLSITNNEEQVQSADKAGLTGLEWISIPSGGVRLFLRALFSI